MYRESQPIAEGAPFFDFSFTRLAHRDIRLRFSDQERVELGFCIQNAWEMLRQDQGYKTAEVVALTADNFSWGKYPDGEAYALSTAQARDRLQIERKQHTRLYAAGNLEDSDDVLAAQTILDSLHNPQTILATMYFPYERGDRPEIRPDGKQELLLLQTLVENLKNSNVKGLIHINPHSPVFPWYCLQEGIAPLSLSALPRLIREAQQVGLLQDTDFVTANGDDGAKSSRQLLTQCLGCNESVNGIKHKIDGKTIVTYSPEDLEKVYGKTVIFTEDIISTGGTMMASILQLLNEGHAKQVIILATYPIFAGSALERLGFDSRVKIITTDGRTPLTDIRKSENITIVPMKDSLTNVLELDKQGMNFWSQKGKESLDTLGFCLFPW